MVVIAGSIGIALTLYSRAATPTVAREAEAGTLSGGAQQLADASASSGQAVKFRPASESTPKRLLGIYYSGGADATSMTDLGLYADISSTYYQPNEISKIEAREKARMDRGTASNLTLTTKETNHMAGIADGDSTSIAWLDSYVAALKKVADYAETKDMPVYATLEHEWEPKVNQSVLTGRATDPAVYGKALSTFFQKVRQNAPKVSYTYWVAGSDNAKMNAVMAALTVAPKVIAADPYVNESAIMDAAANWNRHINKFRSSGGALHTQYNRLKGLVPANEGWQIQFAIAEHGFQTAPYVVNDVVQRPTTHTDAQIAAYFTNLRQHMKDADVVFAIFFNSDRDVPYKITPGAVHPVPAAVNNLRNSFLAPAV